MDEYETPFARNVTDPCGEGDIAVRLISESGSLYELNLSRRVWKRLMKTKRSGPLRAKGGEIVLVGPIRVGVSLVILYQPYDSDTVRLLATSPICWASAGALKPRSPKVRDDG